MRDRVLAWLEENVPPARLGHILRVEQMSALLASHHDIKLVEKAAEAGLMHDLAKNFSPQRLWQMAVEAGLEIDPVAAANPHLLHADVSALIAKTEFGVEDEEILQAIANHTLGRPGMSWLSCIVFLADSLEPGRGDTPELEVLRQVSRENLYQAVWQTCDYSLNYLMGTNRLIHPRAVLTRNWAIQMAGEKQLADSKKFITATARLAQGS
jgi:predicted HD superfamily hydrolase involved in NAD metabolism